MIIILLSFINLSLATSERSKALYSNPAGLSIHSYPEISIRSDDYWISMNLPFMGFAGGIRFMSDSVEYIVGSSPFHYRDIFSLGYKYSSWESKYTLGVMYRPIKWTSIGATTEFPSRDGYDFNLGFALMPGWNRMILTSDFCVDRENDGVDFFVSSLSGILEIIDGVKLSLSYLPERNDFEEGKFYGGIELSLGHLLFGGYSGEGDTEGIVTASVIPYPTFLREKPRSVIIEICGNYPELPERKGFIGKKHSFYFLLNLLDYVKDNKKIETVVLHIKNNSLGIAQAEEVRVLLEGIAEGKNLIAYAHSFGLKGLFLASAADKIVVAPEGELFFPGIYFAKMYLKGTLDKLDIDAQFEKVGRYKSAVETFSREDMSEADREQLTSVLDDMVEVVVGEISESRGIEDTALKSLVDSLGFFTSQQAKDNGLIDSVMYFDQVKDMAGIEGEGKVWRGKRIPRDFVSERAPKIAVLALEGTIVVGESSKSPVPIPLFGSKNIGSETVVEQLEELQEDKSVKAVVLRINSGGGSGLASDLMYRAIMRLREEKPVIISMGDVAASGGYYIAAPGTKIIADKTTITGSIGVFGFKFVTEGFYNKLGITHEIIKWGEHADAMSPHRPFTHYESKIMKKMVRHYYDRFIEKVSENRELTVEEVDSIGMGRIWSGLTAKKINLIDEYGGLLDAIKLAKEEAGLEKYSVVLFPEPLKFLEKLLGLDEETYLPVFKLLNESYLYYEPIRLDLE